jgi:hypothetical protein
MFTNLSSFKLDLEREAKKLDVELEQLLRRIMLQLLRDVVLETPVDTGRARGNWQVSINKSPEGEIEPKADVISEGLATLVDLKQNPYAVVYLTNNVSYIKYLEEGTSQRGGKHMLARGLERVKSTYGF